MADPAWIVEGQAGLGIDIYDRPDGGVIATLRNPAGSAVTPIGVRGNHWQVRTPSGLAGWLDAAEFPIPVLTGELVTEYRIHVATAFPFSDETFEPLLAIQVDTLAPKSALSSLALLREVERIWLLYRPFTRDVKRVSFTVLSRDIDENAPFRSSNGDVLGYRRLARRVCTHLVNGGTWSPLGECKADRWPQRTGLVSLPMPEALGSDRHGDATPDTGE